MNRYYGVNFNNLRKALYLLYFGVDEVKDKNGKVLQAYSQDFNSPKYRYIIPMQNAFDNPLNLKENDTYILYWIEHDESLTQDDFVTENGIGYNRQKCVANILVRFIGKEAEDWARAFRHLCKRQNVTQIWSGVCNAEKIEHTSPIIPQRVDYAGRNGEIAFDIRFKLYYDELIATNWQALTGIEFKLEGNVDYE